MKNSLCKRRGVIGRLLGLLCGLATVALSAVKQKTLAASKWEKAKEHMAEVGPFHGPYVPSLDCRTLTGKAVVGYQGWQNAECKGADIELDGSITLAPNPNTNLIGQKNSTTGNTEIETDALHFANLSAKSSSL